MKLVTTKIGDKLWIDERDEFIGRVLEKTGAYSLEELALLAANTKPERDVLIVGAHIGTFAIPLSRLCRRLVAIEANPDTYHLLERNVKENWRQNITTMYGAADSGDSLFIEFLCGTANSGGSKRAPIMQLPDYVYDNPARVVVPTIRLDDACAGYDFSLVHMDIEGSEVFALRGAQRILAGAQYLSVEFISHHLTHVAGVTVDEWLEPIRPHFNRMMLPGSLVNKRPHIFLEPADWHEMLQNIVKAGVGIENLIFFHAED